MEYIIHHSSLTTDSTQLNSSVLVANSCRRDSTHTKSLASASASSHLESTRHLSSSSLTYQPTLQSDYSRTTQQPPDALRLIHKEAQLPLTTFVMTAYLRLYQRRTHRNVGPRFSA